MVSQNCPIQEITTYFKACSEGMDELDLVAPDEKVGSLKDFYEDMLWNPRLLSLSIEDVIDVENILQDNGMDNFRYLAGGSTAECYRSGDVVLRIGYLPKLSSAPNILGHLLRCACPLTVQSSLSIYRQRAGVLFEVMPYLSMTEDSKVPESFLSLVDEILDRTCFKTFEADKDIAVLPGGTPIYVDPDAIILRNFKEKPTRQDYQRIYANCQGIGLPDSLSWVNDQGTFRQHSQFSNCASKTKFFLRP